MDRMVAYCGLVCTDCEAYIATQSGDRAAVEKVAAKWREHNPDVTVETIMCDGCLSQSEPLCNYCYTCDIRACGLEKGVANCAHCPDYACEKLEDFIGRVPRVRGVLDEIRRSL